MESNISIKERDIEAILGDAEKKLEEFPDLKFICFKGDIAQDPLKAVQISRRMAELKNVRDFLWGCQCSTLCLKNAPQLPEEMAECGLVRIETEISLPDGTHPSGLAYAENDDFSYIAMLSSKAVLPQIVGHILLDKLPQDPGKVEEILGWVEALIRTAPGSFEPGLSPLLRVDSALASALYPQCNLLTGSTIRLENYESCPLRFTGIKREWPIIVQQKYYSRIISSMSRLEAKGKIPHKTVLSHFTLYENYGIDSVWHSTVFKKNKALFGFYNLLSRGAVSHSADIAEGELDAWRPQRTIDMWTSADYKKGYPCIGGYVLSPLEYELFLYSTGKLTLHHVLKAVFSRFGSRFEDYEEFRKTAMSILKAFEDRLWLVYAAI